MVKRKSGRKPSHRVLNKRGTIRDVIVGIVVVFAFAIAAFTTVLIVKAFNENRPLEAHSARGQAILDRADSLMPRTYDVMTVILFFGFGMASVVSAFLVRTHPAFAVFSILLLMIGIFLTVPLHNAFDTLTNSDRFATLVTPEMRLTNFLLGNYPLIWLGIGALVLIVLFSVTRGESRL